MALFSQRRASTNDDDDDDDDDECGVVKCNLTFLLEKPPQDPPLVLLTTHLLVLAGLEQT